MLNDQKHHLFSIVLIRFKSSEKSLHWTFKSAGGTNSRSRSKNFKLWDFSIRHFKFQIDNLQKFVVHKRTFLLVHFVSEFSEFSKKSHVQDREFGKVSSLYCWFSITLFKCRFNPINFLFSGVGILPISLIDLKVSACSFGMSFSLLLSLFAMFLGSLYQVGKQMGKVHPVELLALRCELHIPYYLG